MDYVDGIKELVKKYQPKKGLEIGLHLGVSAKAFLESCSGTLLSIDHNNAHDIQPGARHTIIIGDSSTVMKGLKEKFDYIFIDGDHTYDGVKKDIKAALPLLDKKGIIVFDDYGLTGNHWGVTYDNKGYYVKGEYGVKEAVDELMKGWEEIPTELANGGKAYIRN